MVKLQSVDLRPENAEGKSDPKIFPQMVGLDADEFDGSSIRKRSPTLRILGMSWGVKTTCFEASGMSLGGSGVSIGGVKIVRVKN